MGSRFRDAGPTLVGADRRAALGAALSSRLARRRHRARSRRLPAAERATEMPAAPVIAAVLDAEGRAWVDATLDPLSRSVN